MMRSQSQGPGRIVYSSRVGFSGIFRVFLILSVTEPPFWLLAYGNYLEHVVHYQVMPPYVHD